MRVEWRKDVDLRKRCWFGCAGPAKLAASPKSAEDLVNVLEDVQRKKIDYTVLGACSNVLIRQGGIAGATILIGKGLASVDSSGDIDIVVGSGLLCVTAAMAAAKRNIAGLEFLIGIPGSMGGAVAMNAGCYGSDIKDVIHQITVWLPTVGVVTIPRDDLHMEYRRGNLPAGAVVMSAVLRGRTGSEEQSRNTMQKMRARRKRTQPITRGTGGSTFRNPHGPENEPKAWQLIDKAGCRGLNDEEAQISGKHCNFIINKGDSPHSIERLGETVRQRVNDKTGYQLEWEIHRLGLCT